MEKERERERERERENVFIYTLKETRERESRRWVCVSFDVFRGTC